MRRNPGNSQKIPFFHEKKAELISGMRFDIETASLCSAEIEMYQTELDTLLGTTEGAANDDGRER
jgi:hypothetical protein